MLLLLLLKGAQLLHNVRLLQHVEVLLILELVLGVACWLLLRAKGERGSPLLHVSPCLDRLNLDWMIMEGRLQNGLEVWRGQRETGGRQCREA